MFIVTSITIFISLTFYSAIGYKMASSNLVVILTIAGLTTVVEGISPKGLDNLSSCFTVVAVYLLSTSL